MPSLMLAGVPVRHQDVLDLVQRLLEAGFEDTADALSVALDAGKRLVAVNRRTARRSSRARGSAYGLAELRGVLLR